MKVTILDPARDQMLRGLDVAPAPDQVDQGRQSALLRRVLASDPGTGSGSTPPGGRLAVRRLALAGVAAAAVAAAALALPGLGNGYAYASWTPRPEPVTAEALALVRTACLEEFGAGPPANPGVDRRSAKDLRVRLAERRGTWVSMLLSGTQPDTAWEVSCIAELPSGATEVKHVSVAASGGGGFAAPQNHELVPGGVTEFGVDRGLFGSGRREPVSVTSGQVGPDVVGVTIHSGNTTAEASMKDGTYAVWWPGTAFDGSTPAPSGQGGPRLTITYDLTLRDGTVLRDVRPTYR